VTPHRLRWEHKVRKILKNRALIMAVLGLLVMSQSILWEYVRVKPTYRFIVEPWSLRGYEVTQGFVVAAISFSLAVFALLIGRGVIKETRVSSFIGVAWLVAVTVLVVYLADVRDIEMVLLIQVALSAIGAVAAVSALQIFIPHEWKQRGRAARAGMWLVAFAVILFGFFRPLFSTARPFWLYILMVALMLAALALLRPPTELATRRTLINGIVGIWVMSMTMSASLRQALLGAQLEKADISAQLLDLQITSGVLIAWFGGLIAFIGAVGMWAKRRDQIIAHERARKQQEAAAESTAQLSA
jgi:hypothetical protein